MICFTSCTIFEKISSSSFAPKTKEGSCGAKKVAVGNELEDYTGKMIHKSSWFQKKMHKHSCLVFGLQQ